MSKPTSLRRTVIFTSIITLISFLYKFTLGVINASMVLIVASLSTLLVLIAKVAFARNVTKTKADKKRAYFIITIATLAFGVLFILFSVLKAFGIDTSNQKTYEGFVGTLFIAFVILMFILSVIKLKGALEKSDITVIGLKEITFVSALTDLVIIEDFIFRSFYDNLTAYLDSATVTLLNHTHNYSALIISVIVIIIPIRMLMRFFKYEAK